MNNQIESEVIEQFGEQWVRFPANEGYYASQEVLKDILGPLASIEDFKEKLVAEIGAGTGRLIKLLSEVGAKHVVAIEPSAAMVPLKAYTASLGSRMTYLQEKGDAWKYDNLDYILSIGVLHHIFDPHPTIKNAYQNLKPNGKMIIWVYGYENNELYLNAIRPLRILTPKLPNFALVMLMWALLIPLNIYIFLCRFLPLPMRAYMLDHMERLDQHSRRITIYDQLNPSWAKYYRKKEAEELLSKAGFRDIHSHHRHGYSWTVIGTK